MYPKVLAIDYGTQRIGVAVSHAILAEPLEILPANPDPIDRIKELIEEHGVTQVIVGLSENKMAEKSRQFAVELQKQISCPVELTDETLSSASVHQKLYETSQGKQKYKGHIDHLAAAEFLQEWLDTHQ